MGRHGGGTGTGPRAVADGRAGARIARPAGRVPAARLEEPGVSLLHAAPARRGHAGSRVAVDVDRAAPAAPVGTRPTIVAASGAIPGNGALRASAAAPANGVRPAEVVPPGPVEGGRGLRRPVARNARVAHRTGLAAQDPAAAGVPCRGTIGVAGARTEIREADLAIGEAGRAEARGGSRTVSDRIAARRVPARPIAGLPEAARPIAGLRAGDRRDPGGSGSPSPASTAPDGGASPGVGPPPCAMRAPVARPTEGPRPIGGAERGPTNSSPNGSSGSTSPCPGGGPRPVTWNAPGRTGPPVPAAATNRFQSFHPTSPPSWRRRPDPTGGPSGPG